jgi:Ni/Co efflux regulator RcnB
MKRLVAVVLLAVPLAFGIASAQTAKGKTDAQTKQEARTSSRSE